MNELLKSVLFNASASLNVIAYSSLFIKLNKNNIFKYFIHYSITIGDKRKTKPNLCFYRGQA